MKKLMVYMDDDFHADVKELAHRKKTTMAALVRYALDYTFEDDLDEISSASSLEEYLQDPSSAMSLDDYLKERGIVLSNRTVAKGAPRSARIAEQGSSYSTRKNRRTP